MSTSPDRDAAARRVLHRHVVVDGLRLHYREAGSPDAPAIVLLHGFPSSSHMYRDLIPRLAPHFRVIAPDYVGFGHSDAPDADAFDYRFERLAETTGALLKAAGVRSAVLYLQDYGGPVGLRLALARPGLVRGLVVQNANLYLEGVSAAAAAVFLPLWQEGDECGARAMLEAATTRMQYTAGAREPEALNPDAWLHDQALLDRPGSAARQLALFRDYRHNVADYPAWQAWLREHQPPTLVAWGVGDPFFTEANIEGLQRDLHDVEVHRLDGGHFVLEEQAAEVAALIVRRFARM